MAPPELTVIVPCYNVAEFVAVCLRSILDQPQADQVAVLIVNDGSVDNTEEVILAEIAAHPNMNCELITQKNQGVSCARNAALHLVQTPYVTFIDADDLWAANYLERVMPVIREGRADIIAFNAKIVDVDGRRLGCLHSHTKFSREARFSCSQLAFDAADVAQWHPTLRIYKTRLLSGVRFPMDRYYEDAAVLPMLYARASHIETFRDELYAYRRRPGSITSSITQKHIEDLLLNAQETLAARIAGESSYWKTVYRKMILQIADEIGRAPRALRRSIFFRAWSNVRAHADLNLRVNWILRMLDTCLRSEVKSLLRSTRRPAAPTFTARQAPQPSNLAQGGPGAVDAKSGRYPARLEP